MDPRTGLGDRLVALSISTNSGVRRGLIGLAFVLVGILMMLGQLDILPEMNPWRYFGPAILIVMGLSRMSRPSHETGRGGGGLWLVIIGGWLLLVNLHIWPLRHSWPLLLVALGLSIVWKAVREGREEGARR